MKRNGLIKVRSRDDERVFEFEVHHLTNQVVNLFNTLPGVESVTVLVSGNKQLQTFLRRSDYIYWAQARLALELTPVAPHESWEDYEEDFNSRYEDAIKQGQRDAWLREDWVCNEY